MRLQLNFANGLVVSNVFMYHGTYGTRMNEVLFMHCAIPVCAVIWIEEEQLLLLHKWGNQRTTLLYAKTPEETRTKKTRTKLLQDFGYIIFKIWTHLHFKLKSYTWQ